ncbi:nuclear speckle splicing regulatory protein 1 [Salmo salar]|uniref:Nuclear speckle splicing regulatory protein 1-like n=1 Tax=Salmo salar TaxID=8030 RepID=A0ABM3CKY9_SALSA|nr:nuclear speckle splicing regulatory protein 1-like [Salmo salar]XP_045547209.1 nuclear speckle splicing regulatory protein 1-like [Salmo salar]XP_045547210.1 nuclear speckle splicing regulatory protein 1-like [Salmo salar]XP_045547211.1 nuclear speckle splicing regulatory protein 1-like [Salmo salar]
MEPERFGASSAMSYIMDPSSRDGIKGSLRGSSAPLSTDTDGDVDGDPVQPSVDLELARKKKELEVIEEKIARKKAVLATRQLKHGAKDMPKKQTASTTVKGISKQTKINNTIFKTYNHVTDKSSRVCLPLKRRVLDILSKFRRTPVRYLLRKLKKQNKMRALELMIRAPLENEEAHPLRLRVTALMNQRRSPNNEVFPDDKQHNPTIQRPVHSLRTQEKDIAATGFQRFLNVLNEGVDINKLSKIVNDENELLIVGEELPQVCPTLLEGHVDSSSRSKSSPVEEKVVRLEDEQRYEQMQTLLEIVGLDLGVEELGRLTDRTNDRLYGKMGDLKGKEFENEKGKEKKESEPSLKHLGTSTLPSDSASPSPLLNQHSNMTVEYSSSSNRVWDIETHRDKSERDWHQHSGTRDEDREREEDIVREMERSERDGERDGHRDRDREDSAREGDSPTRGRYRKRCSSTRDKDRVRERDRSERNRKGDGHRHSSTRERDKDIPVVRETNRSERNRDKDGDGDPEKDWDGGRERDRDRSRRDGGRYRSERDRDRDPEKGRDGGREKARDRVRDRDRCRSERERNRDIDKDIERWLQRTRDRDKSSRARDWDSESDWNSHSSTRDWDRARSERDWYGDESRESSIELYSYSMDPIYPVSHPHPFMMANYSPTQYSQYMTYHSNPYTIAFPPGWGYPPGTMPAGIMPPGNMPPGTMLPGIMLPVTMPPGIMPAGAMLPSNKPLLPNPLGIHPTPAPPHITLMALQP